MRDNILPVAPPILTRIFQQLGNGMVDFSNAEKITDIPFPFPYAQMVIMLLLLATFVTPWVCGLIIESTVWATSLTFFGIFGFWCLNYIASEIEMPFGDDANDLPISELQVTFNNNLRVLLHEQAQRVPDFDLELFEVEEHVKARPCNSRMYQSLKKDRFRATMKRRTKESMRSSRRTSSAVSEGGADDGSNRRFSRQDSGMLSRQLDSLLSVGAPSVASDSFAAKPGASEDKDHFSPRGASMGKSPPAMDTPFLPALQEEVVEVGADPATVAVPHGAATDENSYSVLAMPFPEFAKNGRTPSTGSAGQDDERMSEASCYVAEDTHKSSFVNSFGDGDVSDDVRRAIFL